MVFVLSSDGQPLDPCHPARARKLLMSGRAAVFRRHPFTIILRDRTAEESVTHPHRLKLDPGSKTTGIAVMAEASGRVVWAGDLSHRGQQIGAALQARAASCAVIPAGKFAGVHSGRIAIRLRPSFRLDRQFDVHPKYLTHLRRAGGYGYNYPNNETGASSACFSRRSPRRGSAVPEVL